MMGIRPARQIRVRTTWLTLHAALHAVKARRYHARACSLQARSHV